MVADWLIEFIPSVVLQYQAGLALFLIMTRPRGRCPSQQRFSYYYILYKMTKMSKHAEGPSESTVIDRARFTCRSRAPKGR